MDIERKNLLRDWFVEELQKRGANHDDDTFCLTIPIDKTIKAVTVFYTPYSDKIVFRLRVFDFILIQELNLNELFIIREYSPGFKGFILKVIDSMLLDFKSKILNECSEKIK